MLKKAGTVVALTTAGLLALSPLALAGDRHHGGVDVTDQENENENEQANGLGNGNQILNNNAVQFCPQANLFNNTLGAIIALALQQSQGNQTGAAVCTAEQEADQLTNETDQANND